MKNLILVLIFVGCVFIGYSIKKYFYIRKHFFSWLNNFIEKLVNNISYNNEKLLVLVENGKNENKVFKDFLEIFEKFLKGDLLFEKFKNELKVKFNFLNKNEIDEIAEFLNSIGRRTKEEEIEFLNNKLVFLRNKGDIEAKKYDKYANLYLKLFAILGIGLFIVFL